MSLVDTGAEVSVQTNKRDHLEIKKMLVQEPLPQLRMVHLGHKLLVLVSDCPFRLLSRNL